MTLNKRFTLYLKKSIYDKALHFWMVQHLVVYKNDIYDCRVVVEGKLRKRGL